MFFLLKFIKFTKFTNFITTKFTKIYSMGIPYLRIVSIAICKF